MQYQPQQSRSVISDVMIGITGAPVAVAATVEHGLVGLLAGVLVTVLVTVVHEAFWWKALTLVRDHQLRLLEQGRDADEVLRLSAEIGTTSRAAFAARAGAVAAPLPFEG